MNHRRRQAHGLIGMVSRDAVGDLDPVLWMECHAVSVL
jgi:hypothetical protein